MTTTPEVKSWNRYLHERLARQGFAFIALVDGMNIYVSRLLNMSIETTTRPQSLAPRTRVLVYAWTLGMSGTKRVRLGRLLDQLEAQP